MPEEDIVKKYEALKKAFEPKSPPKKEGEWSFNDYLLFVACFVLSSTLFGSWAILHELIEFAKIIHAH